VKDRSYLTPGELQHKQCHVMVSEGS
jgi:hypothetical protein